MGDMLFLTFVCGVFVKCFPLLDIFDPNLLLAGGVSTSSTSIWLFIESYLGCKAVKF
jgi:hypothetical protein